MATKILAKINAARTITHKAGQTVYLGWDEHDFCFTRRDFMCFVDVLRRGSGVLYAACDGYIAVQVDDDTHEVWLRDVCLHLTRREYNTLLNAALTTETRLYGFRAEPLPSAIDGINVKQIATVRPPRAVRFYPN